MSAHTMQRFTPVQRALHWLMAVAILAMLFIGVGMVSTIEPVYLTLVSIHKPLGIAILILAVVRLIVRLRLGSPPLLAPSNAAHTLLWNAHKILALCFFALILLHFAAGLFHALVRRDGVCEAMSPRGDRRP